jgi:hypothetical protein
VERVAHVAAWLLAPVMLAAMIAVTGPTNLMGDFRAFYCAGSAIGEGANPYLEEPLHGCEQRARPPSPPAFLPAVTVPAPLPPGILALFVPLAQLPFWLAATIYGLLSVAAMSTAVVVFARVTGVSSIVLNLAFAGITASQTYFLGQPTTFAFLALAAAAFFVRAERPIAASACAVAAIVEPHLALPALLALLVARPRTRGPIVAFGALLAAAGAFALGPATSIAYVRDVIPAHALSNAYEWQFSLTSILTSAGVDANTAVRWGEAMYAVMTVAGIAVALRVWRTTGDAAALVLVPPAFAVFGGVHVHFQQLAIAFPAILAIGVRAPRLRGLAFTGVALAMIPWNVISASLMTGFIPVIIGWFGYLSFGARRGLVLTLVAAAISISVLLLALAGFGPGATHVVAAVYPPDALAERSWGDFSRAILARPSVLMQWLRVPVLAGLALGLTALTRAAFAI